MDRTYLILGASALGLAGGFAGGYIFAKKKLDAEYNERLDAEIARTREFYKRTYKADDYETPESAAEILLDDAAEALRSYQGVTTIDDVEMEVGDTVIFDEPVEKNIFENGDQLQIDKSDRSPEKPYVVDLDEYMGNPNEHDQISLTYYAGDNVLATDDDEVVDNVNSIVGRMNLNMFGASDPEEPHVVLIRNEKLRTDYEITHSDGKYAHEVLGFEHSDETFQSMRRTRIRDE